MSASQTYYSVSANAAPRSTSLCSDVEADVCVIGGGIAGVSTALHLAQRGYRVVLLEAQCIGSGASGRNGGQVIAGYASGQQYLLDHVGASLAQRMWDLSVEAVALMHELIVQHAIDCDWQWGRLQVAIKPRQRAELQAEQAMLEGQFGYRELELLERSQVQQYVASERYVAGLLDKGSAHLHPLNYTLGLATAAAAAGAALHENSPVTRLEPGPRATVHTARGVVKARHVAVCCNAYINSLQPTLSKRIMPVASYIIATESLGPERSRALIRDNLAVSDANFILDYFRCAADHRLLFGGRVSYSGIDTRDIGRTTRRHMLRVFPQLQDVAIDYAWGGLIDITMSRAPDFGRIAPNIYYLQGFSGHGLALTTLAGKLVAEAISGQAERFDVFTHLRHRNFPGGRWLRTPTLVLAMLWFRLRDLIG
jgi:gamma-glutamylputrescine oxidase